MPYKPHVQDKALRRTVNDKWSPKQRIVRMFKQDATLSESHTVHHHNIEWRYASGTNTFLSGLVRQNCSWKDLEINVHNSRIRDRYVVLTGTNAPARSGTGLQTQPEWNNSCSTGMSNENQRTYAIVLILVMLNYLS